MHDRLTTQLIRLPPENAKSKNAPKHVEAFVCGSIPNGPRLKSAVDMLYVCARVVIRFVRSVCLIMDSWGERGR